MLEMEATETFSVWLGSLRDRHAVAIITAHLLRLPHGLPGDIHPAGLGVSELRIPVGAGYRVYFMQVRNLVLLHGGEASTQARDLRRAQALAAQHASRP